MTRRDARGVGLLDTYTARFGDTIRRQQSAVALRAARMEAELAYKARGTFLANMNHELRTPLNAITGFAGLLKEADTYGFPAEQRSEYLDHILQSAELLLSHIEKILQVADAESGGTKLRKDTFSVAEAVTDALAGIEAELDAKGVVVAEDVADDLPAVHADPEKITVAIQHLVRFATARSESGAMVRLAVRAAPAGHAPWVYVSISTNDSGRSASEVAASLRVFERVHEGLHRGFASDQLCLPIAKSFIELNGGRFNVRPVGERGHLYRFALPAAAQAEAPLRMAS